MLISPAFFFINILNSLALGMNLFIIAVGLTLIFGILRVINFAHGAFFMLGAYVLLSIIQYFGETSISFWTGVFAAMLSVGIISYFIERFLLRHLYDKEHLINHLV